MAVFQARLILVILKTAICQEGGGRAETVRPASAGLRASLTGHILPLVIFGEFADIY